MKHSTLVLDTNVCLDLFVFRDPRWAVLHDGLERGALRAVTRSDCRAEWLAVLNYPQFKLDAAAQADCTVRFDALIACRDKPGIAPPRPFLPHCSDGDDQKFLELAFDEKADALISKDKALLKLARRNLKYGLFLIVSPEAWHRNVAAETDSISSPTTIAFDSTAP
jgi:putative PIN family toxin of toxin-antitoxin system